MGWEEAGRAWGHRALDWAFLLEPHTHNAYEQVFDGTDVREGTALLDVACGSGFACMLAASRGARVSGIDASQELLDIAADRVADGDFRRGDMAVLPWPDETFDVTTSFNGVFYGDGATLSEMRRVTRPGGRCGLFFWGDPARAEHIAYVSSAAALGPPEEAANAAELLRIGEPGVAEEMLRGAGFEVEKRGELVGVSEWPDPETAWRAAASTGIAFAAIKHSGEEAVREAVLAGLEPFTRPTGGIRLRSTLDYVIARR